MLTRIIIFFFLLFSAFAQTDGGHSQTKDSLLSVLKTANEDTAKINALNALSREFINQGDYEQALQYANDALRFFQPGNSLEKSFPKGKADAYNNIGSIHTLRGEYDKGMEFFLKALKIK